MSNGQAASPAYRRDNFLHPGSATSPTALQDSWVDYDRATHYPDLVDDTPSTQSQPSYSPSASSDAFGDQRFQDRLGGSMPRQQDLHRGGPWSREESAAHIKWLELKAAFFTVQCYTWQLHNCHIQISSPQSSC